MEDAVGSWAVSVSFFFSLKFLLLFRRVSGRDTLFFLFFNVLLTVDPNRNDS